ncbi:hypothetical protein Golax_017631, partial [Gossypium laxum]|nr:hypothetical protein [Gossypium laxum]
MGFPLIGETLSFFATSNSIDMHPFINERLKRYGPLFKTNIAGRPVAVSSDPEFNYFLLQQEGKLIELYYMDSFSQMVHHENMSNLGGYFHRYLRRSILGHFGHEPLKRKLLSEFEDVINQELHKWSNLPEVDVKRQTVPGKLPPGSMGFPLIGETLSFFVTSNSIDMHPFVNERLKRYGPLFKTNIAGRPVAVSSDPEFNYFVLQQEGKLIELYYMDSFSQTVHNDNMSNLGGYCQRYLRRSILRHFGHEPLKRKLLSELEDKINHELHKWTTLPEVDVKRQTVPMLFDLTSQILMSHKPEENLGEDLNNMLQSIMTFPLYIPGTTFYKCIQKKRKAIKLTSRVVEERMKGHSCDNSAEGCNKTGDYLDEIVGDIGKEAFLTKEFVPYLLFGLLLATVETISPTITLATMYLLDNPSALQQLTV